jgi:hypothetical protein
MKRARPGFVWALVGAVAFTAITFVIDPRDPPQRTILPTIIGKSAPTAEDVAVVESADRFFVESAAPAFDTWKKSSSSKDAVTSRARWRDSLLALQRVMRPIVQIEPPVPDRAGPLGDAVDARLVELLEAEARWLPAATQVADSEQRLGSVRLDRDPVVLSPEIRLGDSISEIVRKLGIADVDTSSTSSIQAYRQGLMVWGDGRDKLTGVSVFLNPENVYSFRECGGQAFEGLVLGRVGPDTTRTDLVDAFGPPSEIDRGDESTLPAFTYVRAGWSVRFCYNRNGTWPGGRLICVTFLGDARE